MIWKVGKPGSREREGERRGGAVFRIMESRGVEDEEEKHHR